MFSTWTLLLFILCFFSLLFAVALWGSKRGNNGRQSPVTYSLALGVQCTSWAFFGTTTQAAQYGWAFVPTYLGIILVFLLAHPLLIKISRLCHQNQVSSLADFISLRYGQSMSLGIMVSVLCFFGVVPYIVLQLDALTSSFHIVSNTSTHLSEHIGLYVTLLMAVFAILFGTRSLSLTEKHPGLMLTIAVESLLKLFGLVAVGLFVCYELFDGLFDLLGKAQLHPHSQKIIQTDMAPVVYITHMLLGACSLLCLPRQFHINYIENNGEKELHTARLIFPLYLLGMTAFILPIALGGHLYFADGTVNTDSYVLALPVAAGNHTITVISLLGGVSAATSMIIVATLALGIMIANNLVTLVFLKWRFRPGIRRQLQPSAVLFIRRFTVLLVLILAYFYHLQISKSAPLVNSGVIAITLLAQFVPLMLLGLYWSKASKRAAQISLMVGAISWAWWLLWPSIKSSYYFDPVPSDQVLSEGFLLSLVLNLGCFVLLSWLSRTRDHLNPISMDPVTVTPLSNGVRISSLRAVTGKLLDPQQDSALIKSLSQGAQDGYASPALLTQAEQALSSQVGRTSARVLLSAIAEKKHVALSGLVELVEEASQAYQFNHELLQS